MEFQDRALQCLDCRKEFVFSAGEQEFYERKGFKETPKRCKTCREMRKARRDGGMGSSGSSHASGGYGGHTSQGMMMHDDDLGSDPDSIGNRVGGGYSRAGMGSSPPGAGRDLHDAVCVSCGAHARVPFRPAAGRPVYCRDCYASRQGQGPTY